MHKTLTLAAITAVAAAPAAGAAPITFAGGLAQQANVAAYDGTVVALVPDAAGRFALQRSVAGGPLQPILAGTTLATGRVGLDLGASGTRTPYGVYAAGGAIVRFSPQSGATRTFRPSPAVTGDVAVHGKRVAYVAGSGAKRTIRVGTFGVPGSFRVAARGPVVSLDLGASRLAYVTHDRDGDWFSATLHLVAGNRDRVVWRLGTGAMSTGDLHRPAFTEDGTALVFAQTRFGGGPSFIARKDLASGRIRVRPITASYVDPSIADTAWGGDALGLVSSTIGSISTGTCVPDGLEEPDCGVTATGPVAFDRPAPKFH